MNSKMRYGLGLISGAVAIVAAGCGGSGASVPGGSVEVSGGIETSVNRDAPAIPAATGAVGTETTYETQIDGVTKTVHVPATPDGAPAGTPLALFPDGIPIINGEITRSAGDLSVICHGKDGRSTVTTGVPYRIASSRLGLALSSSIALVPGYYECNLEGPITIVNAATKGNLTIGSIKFKFQVTDEGQCSFPIEIRGTTPSNGVTTQRFTLDTRFDPTFAGHTANLIVTNGDGSRFSQKVTLGRSQRYATFSSQKGFIVSKSGLTSIDFTCY